MSTGPDYMLSEDYTVRLKKLNEIRELGVEPYPHKFSTTNTVSKCRSTYEKEQGGFDEAMQGNTKRSILSGRLVLMRAMGKNIFAQLKEGTETIQVVFNRDTTKVEGLAPEAGITDHKFIEKKLDLGDHLGIQGYIFRTNKGELTLFAHKVTLLCKTLLPLPDKYSGLKDKETRYRKRYLDLIANPEVMITFKMRSMILQTMRSFFEKHNFIEVETPILEHTYGGAQAKPFKTHLNALTLDMYMRIALEIPLKKLIVGGMERVFEIGRLFRNEGMDLTHNPEFTSVECYATHWDYNDVMEFTERLFEEIAKKLFDKTHIGTRVDRDGNEHDIDLTAPWRRISLKDSIKEFADFNFDEKSEDELKKMLLDKGNLEDKKIKEASRGHLMVMIFEEFVEHQLIQPTFIYDYPIESTPLCKPHRDPELRKEGIVERFELFIMGTEFANAYTELNDPILQRELLEEQERLLTEGDGEANPMDEDFLEAMSQGMPPTGGLGIGIDRMVMLFAGKTSIRDVLFFPTMKKLAAIDHSNTS